MGHSRVRKRRVAVLIAAAGLGGLLVLLLGHGPARRETPIRPAEPVGRPAAEAPVAAVAATDASPSARQGEEAIAAAPAPNDPRPLYPRCLQALIDSAPGPEEQAILAEILAGLTAADAARRRDAVHTLGLARDPLRARYGSRIPDGRSWRGTDLDPRAAREALRPLLADTDPAVRWQAMAALLRWDAGAEELPRFFDLLGDPDGVVVAGAVRAVRELQEGRPSGAAEDRIVSVLGSRSADVVERCLGQLDGAVLGDVLRDRILEMSRNDATDPRVRRAALKCLAAARGKNRPILEELLRRMRTTEDASEKELALEGLERHVPPDLRPWVADGLVRAVAAGDLYALAAIPRVGAFGEERHVAWLESWTDPEKMAGQYGPDEIPRAVAEAVRRIRARAK